MTGPAPHVPTGGMTPRDSCLWRLARDLAVRVAVCRLRWKRNARSPAGVVPAGVAVVGFLDTASGIGAAGRGLLAALHPWRPVPISIDHCALTPRIPTAGSAPETVATQGPSHGSFGVAVHVYNPDVFLRLVRQHRGGLIRCGRTNLAVVNWETERLPPSWPRVLSLYDRLAAPSRFTADAVQRATGRPVHVVPNCVPPKPVRSRSRTDGHFEFLCLFDHHSDFERKNPLAAIRALRAASRDLPAGMSCRLRVKCHSNTPPEIIARLQAEAAGAAVEIMPQTLSSEQMRRLWQDCDCLVSLHHSEGFGLPVAEALAQGIPVVATRQGGILDFMGDAEGLLVDGSPATPSGRSSYREWSGWIDPNPDAAAAALREVMADYDRATRRAAVGRERLANWTSPEAVLKAVQRATHRE